MAKGHTLNEAESDVLGFKIQKRVKWKALLRHIKETQKVEITNTAFLHKWVCACASFQAA